MAAGQRNGVDSAIALIAALARRGGRAPSAELADELGLSRSSLHRITRALAVDGIVTCARGEVRTGKLAAALIATLAARAEDEDRRRPRIAADPARPPSPDPADAAPAAPALCRPFLPSPRRRLRIGFSTAAIDNPWRVALVHSVEHAAARHGDDLQALTVTNAEASADRQVADIEQMAADGVDGILVDAVSPYRLVGVADRLMQAGIPVVFINRGGIAGMPCLSFVTSNNRAIGCATARWLAETIRGQGTVLLLYGHADPAPSQSRHAAALAEFARHPDIRVQLADVTDFRRDHAREAARHAIEHWGDRIAGVWCDSGLNGAGSLQAFADAGYDPGRTPPHTGGDLNLAYKLAVQRRVKLASVDYPPAMGIRAFDILLASLRGQWVPRDVDVPCHLVVSQGAATPSIRPRAWAEHRVRWDMPDDLVFGAGLGPNYNPQAFRVSYPGNSYNRSVIDRFRGTP